MLLNDLGLRIRANCIELVDVIHELPIWIPTFACMTQLSKIMILVIKVFPEIITKSRSVRKNFIGILRRNLRTILARIDDGITVQAFWDKIEVSVPEDSPHKQYILAAVQKIPGIDTVLVVDKFEFDTKEDIEKIVELNCCERVQNKSFVVRVKRSGKHSFKSLELERSCGGVLLRNVPTCSVDLHNPDEMISMEIKDNYVFLISQRIKGLGGFPLGTQSDVVSLISGGFDSTVATYQTIRRGIKAHYLFFSLGGKAHEAGVKQVSQYIWENYSSSHKVKFITIPFEEVIGEILAKVKNSYMGVVLKRMMLRAATKVAEKMEIDALITGESVAQVSSQTIRNLAVIDRVTEKLVLRPIATMDKNDIIDIAREIGTEDFVKNIPEYCGVISDKPTVKADFAKCDEVEQEFDFSILDKAIEAANVESIDKVLSVSDSKLTSASIVSIPEKGQVIVDLRHPIEEDDKLEFPNNDVIEIPFYAVEKHFPELDQGKEYLFYCDKGVMSEMHASNLVDAGYRNIRVIKF